MKKSLIAGAGVAALAIAAVPFAGAFAANSITDTVQITISTACNVGSTTSSSGTGTTLGPEEVANGGTKTWTAGTDGGAIYVSCNDASGWNVKAVGVGDDASDKTAMNASTSTNPDIATGTATSGATSNWAFQVTGTNSVSSFNSFTDVPSSATKVAGNSAAVSEGVLNTGYRVYVSPTQAADTYTGKVQYTVSVGTS